MTFSVSLCPTVGKIRRTEHLKVLDRWLPTVTGALTAATLAGTRTSGAARWDHLSTESRSRGAMPSCCWWTSLASPPSRLEFRPSSTSSASS